MIVVIGLPRFRPPSHGRRPEASGLAAEVARAAGAAGAAVQLVGKVGDDPSGDALVLVLTRDGIGHVAVLRDPAHPTPIDALSTDVDEFGIEVQSDSGAAPALAGGPAPAPAAEPDPGDGVLPSDQSQRPSLDAGDVELALRYLADFQVVILAGSLPADARAVAFDAAAFSSAHVVELLTAADEPPTVPEADTAFEAPDSDPDGAFATLVGRYAAAVDAGRAPAEAFAAASRAAGWERATSDD